MIHNSMDLRRFKATQTYRILSKEVRLFTGKNLSKVLYGGKQRDLVMLRGAIIRAMRQKGHTLKTIGQLMHTDHTNVLHNERKYAELLDKKVDYALSAQPLCEILTSKLEVSGRIKRGYKRIKRGYLYPTDAVMQQVFTDVQEYTGITREELCSKSQKHTISLVRVVMSKALCSCCVSQGYIAKYTNKHRSSISLHLKIFDDLRATNYEPLVNLLPLIDIIVKRIGTLQSQTEE